MLRNVDLSEISDGRLYDKNDMVKADCGGCKGCSACCRGMGTSIVLDPLDIHRLTSGIKLPFEALLATSIELNLVDGLILPNLKMTGNTDACSFLDENGRCSVHSFRPGFCRLFPLGRFYEDDSFQYFLQIHECPYPGKTKVKVSKWIDVADMRRYEHFISEWHYFLKTLQEYAMEHQDQTEQLRAVSMYILQQFYLAPYVPTTKEGMAGDVILQDQEPVDGEDRTEDFYQIFHIRLKEARKKLGLTD